MLKCLAPLTAILVASTVAPHAENCPVFPQREDYLCKTYDSHEKLTNKPLFPIKLKTGGGAYSVTTRSGKIDLVPGSTSEQVVNGQTIVTTVTCDSIETSKHQVLPAILLKKQVKGGAVTGGTYFYSQDGGVVRLEFGLHGNTPGLIEKNSCSQNVPRRTPPASPAQTPAPQRQP